MDFFDVRRANLPQDEKLIIRKWGAAEAAGTAYGQQQAAARGAAPSDVEQAFLRLGDAYRDGSLPVIGGALGGGIGFMGGGAVGFRVCGPKCALAGALVGSGAGAAAGYGFPKYAEDPRNIIGSVHPVYYVAYSILYFR